jgi:N-formylglutamate deformylase
LTEAWLTVKRGDAPLIVSIPHAGTQIAPDIEARLVSPWLGRRDADWWLPQLYDFALGLGATVVRTDISRTVIDVNRDPSGASLYPGRNTTDLCPTISFDGAPLWKSGQAPNEGEIADRRDRWFNPYHAAIAAEIARLRVAHRKIVVYDAHSIRSVIPHLFDGTLPNFNIGSNDGRTCDPVLTEAVSAACAVDDFSQVVNGRFKGGWSTRRYGNPTRGVHAIQMELGCRGYIDEPDEPNEANWPTPYDPLRAAALREPLSQVLQACLRFARS